MGVMKGTLRSRGKVLIDSTKMVPVCVLLGIKFHESSLELLLCLQLQPSDSLHLKTAQKKKESAVVLSAQPYIDLATHFL